MARDLTSHQKNIVKNYYQNLDTIMLQKLGELVTELYLAETAKKKDALWKRADKAMTKLKIAPDIHTHIMSRRSVEILAKNLQEWQNHSRR